MIYDGEIAAIRSRKISEETCRKFNVRIGEGPTLRFPYFSKDRAVVAYKERGTDKDFRWVGRNDDAQLFGQQLWGSGKSLVITEGEIDCLSVYQARPTWPVVSIPNGAASAKKSLQAQLDWLLGFDEIILCFDNDEAGTKATQECAQLFPPDKVFLANLGQYKDASEALQAGDADSIRQAVWNKRSYSPRSIVAGTDLFDLVSKPLHGKDADYPYAGLNALTSGLRLGELVTMTAGSGTGKSTLCGEICQCLVDQDFPVGYIALEESVQRTALRLMTVKANKPLHLNNEIPEDELLTAFESSVGSGRVYLRDGFGSVDPDVILNDIRYLVKAKGVRWVILDHLSILLSGNESDDERKLIDRTMTKLRSFVEETGIGMILISHLRRAHNDKGHEDGAAVSLTQLRGSHSIVQLSDLVVAIQRNITSGENTSELVVLKNRFNGQTGPAGILTYNKETGRLTEIPMTVASSPNNLSYEDF
jgi:twinkle protein